MSDWLSIELVLGTLLVTTFTSVGLLGLWTATSRWHWFLRTGIALAALSPLLLIPAHEPFLLLLTQLAVVAMGAPTHRSWCSRRSGSGAESLDASALRRRRSFRFSLSTVMLATVVAAIALAIAVRIPYDAWYYWPDYLLTGATLGVVALLSAWLVYGRQRRILRLGIAAIAALVLSIPLSYFDDWPQNTIETVEMMRGTRWPNVGVWTTIWFVIVPSVLLLSTTHLLLLRSAGIASLLGCGMPTRSSRTRSVRCLVAVSSAVLLAATSVPPITTCWELLHPLPVPIHELPDPNGYDDLVAAGKMFERSGILNLAVEPQSTDELAAEVAKYSAAYDRCRAGLSREIAMPLWNKNDDLGDFTGLGLKGIGRIRSVSRALYMESELAWRENRHADSATIAAEAIQLGNVVGSHGMVIDFLVGSAIEGSGKKELYRVTDQLSSNICRALIQDMVVLDRQREPLAAILHRDRICTENAFGWYGHLYVFLWDFAGGGGVPAQLEHDTYPCAVATSRLLIITLALRDYVVERGAYPDDLHKLTPHYLPSLPNDPFALAGGGFVYRLADDGYVLYSLGPNGQDDDGAPQEKTADGYFDRATGDLRLDVLFEREDG